MKRARRKQKQSADSSRRLQWNECRSFADYFQSDDKLEVHDRVAHP